MKPYSPESLYEAVAGGSGDHPGLHDRLPSRRFASILCSALIMLSGCALPQPASRFLTPSYRPQNAFVWGSSLPAQVRRVAVLPIDCDQNTSEMADGRDALEPIMRVELAKLRRFELMSISPEQLQASTGLSAWDCADALPGNLCSWLADGCGCDAVLFCRLTTFRGFPPLAVGWRMRLVDVRTHATLWAGDELFDAGQPAVQAGARHYQLAELGSGRGRPDAWTMSNSPRQFGQYAVAQLLATLPER